MATKPMQRSWMIPAGLTLFAIALLLMIWKLPQYQSEPIQDVEKRIAAENAARTVLVQSAGGLFFLVTAYFSWQQLKATQRNLEIAQRNLKATEDNHVAERFSSAIELLAHDSIHVRLGGIYALEKIAESYNNYYWQVMETLTAYVRERSPSKQLAAFPETDIQAVMTVLGRRRNSYQFGEVNRLDLSRVNLSRLYLSSELQLTGADLYRTNLSDAKLRKVSLPNAIFQAANLERAKLEGANLREANFKDANLKSAILTSADLAGAIGLTWEQLNQAETFAGAILPDYLVKT